MSGSQPMRHTRVGRQLPASLWLVLGLTTLCFSSAIAIVWSKHQARQTHADISRIQSAINELNVRWNQLRIEESTLASHARIESMATERLGMRIPGLEGSVMIARHGVASGVLLKPSSTLLEDE